VQLRIDKAVLARTKKLLLQKEPGTLPVLLDLPAPDPKSQPKPPQIGIDSPVVQNTDQMVVAVENATSLVAVTMGGQTVHFERKDASSILLTTLRADGVTTEQKTRELKFAFKGGATVTVKLEVVAARVGVRSP
jgi:RNase P/RNase MRP subunit p29